MINHQPYFHVSRISSLLVVINPEKCSFSILWNLEQLRKFSDFGKESQS